MTIAIFNDQIIVKNPSWYSGESFEHEFQFTAPERQVYRKRKPIKTSEWAEEHRILPSSSSLSGKWKNKINAFQVGIMDSSDNPYVKEIVVCKAPQTGISEVALNILAKRIDRDPGPAMFVYPDRITAEHNSGERVLPMIKSSRRLSKRRTGYEDDEGKLHIKLTTMDIYFGWASSPSSLANKAIKWMVADEIDKPGFYTMKAETSSLKLIDHRVTTNRRFGSLYIKISTPTVETGNITVELKSCQVIFEFWVVCPSCGHAHLMLFKNIKWDGGDDADPDTVRAYYKCPNCSDKWDDIKRDLAVRAGYWVDNKKKIELNLYLEKYRPAKIGFHLPSWLSFFVSLSEVAKCYLKSLEDTKDGNDEKKNLDNGHKAIPHKSKKAQSEKESIIALKDTRPKHIVPGGDIVSFITAAVDTQGINKGFWYEIRAWGYGHQLDSWGIREGHLPTFSAIEDVLWGTTYKDLDNVEYVVGQAIQDSGGHRTAEVYEFCRMNRGRIIPYKGASRRMDRPFRFSKLEFFPDGTPIPGGLQLLVADPNFYKDQLFNKLQIASGDPGAWNYHKDITDHWAKMMVSEYVNEKGVWACLPGKDNHGWDCSVYNLILADYLNIRDFQKEKEVIEEEEENINEETEESGGFGGW